MAKSTVVPVVVDLLEEREDVDRQMRVQVARGLVREDQRGLGHDRARHRDALLLAAREVRRALPTSPREADALEGLHHTRADQALGHIQDLERDRDVLEHRPMLDDLEVLKDDAQVAAQEGNRLGGEPRDVPTAEEDAPLVDRMLSVDELQERALARAARARDEEELATLDRQVETAQRRRVAPKVFMNVLEDEDRPLGCDRVRAHSGPKEGEGTHDAGGFTVLAAHTFRYTALRGRGNFPTIPGSMIRYPVRGAWFEVCAVGASETRGNTGVFSSRMGWRPMRADRATRPNMGSESCS